MNEELMLEYLLQMQGMAPEKADMLRKQKQIDALRGSAMQTPEGQMIGKHYVPPSMTQYAAQLGQGYMAGQGQKQQDVGTRKMSETQGAALRAIQERLRRKQMGMSGDGTMDTTSDYAAGY